MPARRNFSICSLVWIRNECRMKGERNQATSSLATCMPIRSASMVIGRYAIAVGSVHVRYLVGMSLCGVVTAARDVGGGAGNGDPGVAGGTTDNSISMRGLSRSWYL